MSISNPSKPIHFTPQPEPYVYFMLTCEAVPVR